MNKNQLKEINHKRIIAIGDIHGCLNCLEKLIQAIEPNADDFYIFLGDYIDRGSDSKGVINFLMNFKKNYPSVFIKGNHEEMILSIKDYPEYFVYWIDFGGLKTLKSYDASINLDGLKRIPASHWKFFETCIDYFESDKFIFSHALPNPQKKMEKQTDHELRWKKEINVEMGHMSRKKVIFGHVSQRSGRILKLEHAVCIDTCVYGKGYLTGLDIKNGKLYQTSKKGEVLISLIDCWPDKNS